MAIAVQLPPNLSPPAIYWYDSSTSPVREMRASWVRSQYPFATLRRELARARDAREDWDTYGSPAPNALSVHSASEALREMESLNLKPSGVRPSAEGGIGIYFVQGQRYSHVETLNSGEVVVMSYDGRGLPEVIEVQNAADLVPALDRLREYHTI